MDVAVLTSKEPGSCEQMLELSHGDMSETVPYLTNIAEQIEQVSMTWLQLGVINNQYVAYSPNKPNRVYKITVWSSYFAG
jgi:hypothetical protein